MSTQAKCGLVGVVLLILVVAVVWDRVENPQIERIGRWTVGSIKVDGVEHRNQPWAEELERILNDYSPKKNPAPGSTTAEQCVVTFEAWSYIEPRYKAYCGVAVLRFPDGRRIAGFCPSSYAQEPMSEQGLSYRERMGEIELKGKMPESLREWYRGGATNGAVYCAAKNAFQDPRTGTLRCLRGSIRGIHRDDDLWPVLAAGYLIDFE